MVSLTVRVPSHRSKPAHRVAVPWPDHSPCNSDDDTGCPADGGVLGGASGLPRRSATRPATTRAPTSPASASRSQTLDRRDRSDIRFPPEGSGAQPLSTEGTDTAAPDPTRRSGAAPACSGLSDRAAAL